jgi:hypothetical protein
MSPSTPWPPLMGEEGRTWGHPRPRQHSAASLRLPGSNPQTPSNTLLHRDAVGPQGRIEYAQRSILSPPFSKGGFQGVLGTGGTPKPPAGESPPEPPCVHPPSRTGEDTVSASSTGKCRGAKPLCREFEGVPRSIFLCPQEWGIKGGWRRIPSKSSESRRVARAKRSLPVIGRHSPESRRGASPTSPCWVGCST